MNNCRPCNKPLLWLRLFVKETGITSEKPNPIDSEPNAKGNLVLDRERGIYRFATDEEKQSGRNLYISHFATCPNARSFRR